MCLNFKAFLEVNKGSKKIYEKYVHSWWMLPAKSYMTLHLKIYFRAEEHTGAKTIISDTLVIKSCKMNPPPLPKTSNHQHINYSICMFLQRVYLHLIGIVWKAHSLKNLSEYGPEQWKIRQEVRWDSKAHLKSKRRNSVDENAGQVCCAQQPGALPWDFPPLSQPQHGPVPPGDPAHRVWQLQKRGSHTAVALRPAY